MPNPASIAQRIGQQYAKIAAEEEGFSLPWWSVPLLGVGAGLGTYGLSRIPKLVSESRYPILRKLQEMSGGEMAFHATDLDKVVERIKELGKELGNKKLPARVKVLRDAIYGPEVRWQHGKMPETILGEEAPKMVFSGYKRNLPEGMINPALGPVTGAEHRKTYDLAHRFENKAFQARVSREFAPEMMPETITIQELRKLYKLPLREGRHLAEDLKAIQRAAKEHLGGKALIKPSAPRAGGDPGYASLGAFPSTSSDLANLNKRWKEMGKDYSRKTAPGYKGRLVDEMLANNAIFQRKVPIKAMPSGVGHEYRVHVVGGRAVPSMTVPWVQPQSLLDRLSQKFMARRVTRWAQKQIDLLPEKYKGISMGMDVVPLQGGGFRALELNPGGQSGFLDFPGSAHKLYRAVTGRSTPEIALNRAVQAGLGTAGVAGITSAVTD